MPHEIHAILVACRTLLRTHEASGAVPITSLRTLIAEIEQRDRDAATELDANAARLVDERNAFGYPTKLGQL
jgi:hypothetical protein